MHIRISIINALLLAAVLLMSATNAKMVGAPEGSDAADASNHKAALFAVDALNQGHELRQNFVGADGTLELVKLVKVSTQVVAGTNYRLTLTLKDAEGKQHDVEATVWARPWLEASNDAANPAWQLTSLSLVGA